MQGSGDRARAAGRTRRPRRRARRAARARGRDAGAVSARGLALGPAQLADAGAGRLQRRERLAVAGDRGVEARRVDRDDAEPARLAGSDERSQGELVTTSMCSAARRPRSSPGERSPAGRARASSLRTAVRSVALAGSPSPPATTSRTRRESANARATSAPAAATASSKLESGATPTSPEARASSTTARSSPAGSSSSLTMRRP